MMRYILIFSSLLLWFGCGNGSSTPGGFSICGALSDGYYCDETSKTIFANAGGSCNPLIPVSDQCPPPYNACVNNRCTITQASASSPRTWFATDPIRPGVTSTCNTGSVGCPPANLNHYIYNIMAKGYASLDDWCMSQAQQSVIPAMRNITSWKAMIIAQPDNTVGASTPDSMGNSRYLFLQALAGQTASVFGPSKNQFSGSTNDAIEDRNGAVLAKNAYWQQGAWGGINRSFCQEIVCSEVKDCSPLLGGCQFKECRTVDAGWEECLGFGSYIKNSFCNVLGKNCTGYVTPEPLFAKVELGPYAKNTAGNSWGSFNSSDPAGILTLISNGQCSASSGFDFATDCNGGTFFSANGSQSKPIICYSN